MKNIIFDLGNVVINTDYNKIINNFTNNEEEKEFILNDVIKSPYYELGDTGFIEIEDQIDIINDYTNNKYPELVKDFLLNYIKYKTWNGDILDILKKLKENGYKLYVLSNISDYVYKNFKEILESLFDGIVVSYEIHKVKPNEAIYKYLLNKYNLNPEDSLFIDDRKINIETANKLGIKGRQVLPDNIDDIKQVLKEYGVLL